MDRVLSGSPTWTGRNISTEGALEYVAVYACCSLISETIGAMPLHLYSRLGTGGKRTADEHPLYALLHDQPNPEMSAIELREALVGHLCTWGNAYCEIQRNDRGVVALWPLRPDKMELKRTERGQLFYSYRLPDGTKKPFDLSLIWHIHGFGSNGLTGYSPIGMARQAIGLGMAVQEYGARFFANDSKPGGVLKHPGRLSDKGAERLKASWEEAFRGLENKHRVAVLEEGVEWQGIGLPYEDARFLETRKFEKAEIESLYRVPPHMVADVERNTSWGSGIETMSIGFVTYTLLPYMVRIEQSVRRDLLLPSERRQYYAKHVASGLLRGDAVTRATALQIQRQNGIINADEWRELEDMNPLPDGQGQVYIVPMNMMSADSLTTPEPAPQPAALPEKPPVRALESGEQRSIGSRRRIAQAHHGLFFDAAARVVKRETQDVGRAAEKHLQKRDDASFFAWLERYYRTLPDDVVKTLLPVLRSYSDLIAADAAAEIGVAPSIVDDLDAFCRQYLAFVGQYWAASSQGQLRQIVRNAIAAGADPLAAIQERLQEWLEKRPEKVAKQHTVEAENAVAKHTWKRGGIKKLRWRASGKNCPYCANLDGKVVGIEDTFVGAGEDYQPDGTDAPLKPSRNIGHAPLHGGCDCSVTPER